MALPGDSNPCFRRERATSRPQICICDPSSPNECAGGYLGRVPGTLPFAIRQETRVPAIYSPSAIRCCTRARLQGSTPPGIPSASKCASEGKCMSASTQPPALLRWRCTPSKRPRI